jgi:hypothetical protein
MTFGAPLVFVVGAAIVLALFWAYLVWYGRWVSRRWVARTPRQRRSYIRRSSAVVGVIALVSGIGSLSRSDLLVASPFLVVAAVCVTAFALALRHEDGGAR